jgi:hypothetical protein
MCNLHFLLLLHNKQDSLFINVGGISKCPTHLLLLAVIILFFDCVFSAQIIIVLILLV